MALKYLIRIEKSYVKRCFYLKLNIHFILIHTRTKYDKYGSVVALIQQVGFKCNISDTRNVNNINLENDTKTKGKKGKQREVQGIYLDHVTYFYL